MAAHTSLGVPTPTYDCPHLVITAHTYLWLPTHPRLFMTAHTYVLVHTPIYDCPHLCMATPFVYCRHLLMAAHTYVYCPRSNSPIARRMRLLVKAARNRRRCHLAQLELTVADAPMQLGRRAAHSRRRCACSCPARGERSGGVEERRLI